MEIKTEPNLTALIYALQILTKTMMVNTRTYYR